MDTVSSPAAILLPPGQRRLWDEINNTIDDSPPTTLAELFVRNATADPQHTAVIAARRRLDYGEILALASRLADQLVAGRSRAVGICVEPGWEQVVAVAGSTLAGVGFYAIDPRLGQPVRWRRLADLDIDTVLTQSWLDERLSWPDGVVRIAVDTEQAAAMADRPPSASPEDVWCWYTPVDSADPPVPVTQDAIASTTADLVRRFEMNRADRVLLLSPIGDPVSLTATACLLSAGVTIVVPDDIDLHSPPAWFELLRRERITVWHATPTLTGLLAEHLQGRDEAIPPQVRLALIGGEPLPPSLVHRLRQAARHDLRVANLGPGGPAGVWATCMDVTDVDANTTATPAEHHVPIGSPLANKRVYVMSEALAPCPVWVTGRIYTGGRGLRPVPASVLIQHTSGEWIYRTNLTGRLLPNGALDVVGDDATNISVHGHPLSLLDVEAKLAAHPAVLRAAVVPAGGGSLAYVKVEPASGVSGSDLLDYLRKKMSPYLLPARVEMVGAFALTTDGRLDRAALVAAAATEQARASVSVDAGEDTATDTALAARVCGVAADILGLPDVDPELNLLDLGATSVQLVQLAMRVEQELGLAADVEELLRFPSVAVLIASATAASPAAGDFVTDQPIAGVILDPLERVAFKDGQPGIRRDLPSTDATSLAEADLARLWRRRTHRQFESSPVALPDLSTLLSSLRCLSDGDEKRYAYPSAGALYPVQTYLTLVEGRTLGIPAGAYYYHPLEHRLYRLAPNAAIPASAHAWNNRGAFRSSSFAIYLVADRQAIDPMYGPRARDYSLIETGAMCQLLMTVAEDLGLGLCPVGDMDASVPRELLRLGEDHEVLHVLLGGVRPADAVAAGQREREQAMLREVSALDIR